MTKNIIHRYSDKEEFLNILTHGFGLLASLVIFPFLIKKSFSYTNFWQQLSFIIYGCSMIILYAASTFYHAAKKNKIRRILNIFDHAAIYILIAGSYSPFCLVVLPVKLGWCMFIIVWCFAFIGVILKLFFTGRFEKLSTILYVLMGWQAIIFINPLMKNLSENGLFYLITGGVFYTIGAIMYSIDKLPYNHAIFHVFVLGGSFCHFISIYFYM